MSERFKPSEWTATRRMVWDALIDGKCLYRATGAEVVRIPYPYRVSAINPMCQDDPSTLRLTPICEVSVRPFQVEAGEGLSASRFQLTRAFDGKHNDEFFVSECGMVFIREGRE